MDAQSTLLITPYILSALISLCVGGIIWGRKPVPGARLFAWIAFFETIWTVGYIFQLTQPGLDAKLFWNNVQFLGAVGAPLMYLGFALEYARPTGFGLKHTSWKYLLPLAIAILVFIWTDGWHGLFRGETILAPGEPFSRLVFPNGAGFGLFTLYGYSLMVLTTLILVARYLNATALYRGQIGLVMTGILIPWVVSIVTALNLVPYALHDITPITFGFCNLVIAWALFRTGLLRVIPVARDYLVDHLQEGILVLDNDLRIVDINPAARRLLCMKDISGLGEQIGAFLSLEPAWFDTLAPDEPLRKEMTIPIDEDPRWVEIELNAMHFSGSNFPYYLVTLRDVQERKAIEDQLEQLASTDSLTGAYNRRNVFILAQQEIEKARARGHPLCMILMDVDHFKLINDTFGHRVGDRVLEGLARRCQENLRVGDVFGRYGGEEFLVVLPDTDLKTAVLVGERLRSAIDLMRIENCPERVHITISLGVASLDACRNRQFEELLELADRALYSAKTTGRNSVFTIEMSRP